MNKQDIIVSFGKDAQDTGSTSVQIALLTAKIRYLTDHMRKHKKDYASRLGLMKTVGQRKRLLDYLKRENMNSYKLLIEKLEIRK